MSISTPFLKKENCIFIDLFSTSKISQLWSSRLFVLWHQQHHLYIHCMFICLVPLVPSIWLWDNKWFELNWKCHISVSTTLSVVLLWVQRMIRLRRKLVHWNDPPLFDDRPSMIAVVHVRPVLSVKDRHWIESTLEIKKVNNANKFIWLSRICQHR